MTLKILKSKPGLALIGASGLVAAAAFAGTTVISHAAPPAAGGTQNTQADPADTAGTDAPDAPEAPGAEKADAPEAPGSEKAGAAAVDAPGGPDDQSGAQDGPNQQ